MAISEPMVSFPSRLHGGPDCVFGADRVPNVGVRGRFPDRRKQEAVIA